ncbi:NAD(P)/FAD-dependent oxidoreductase [Candidatus Bathyarchaeota archaeon]|nr:NAD(P)/FAD-dependent oxidoreductase [Candidatus Bathyarchaeota archaeon]
MVMCIEESDIAVIGAGPAGLIAAREASLRGAEVSVFEEHNEIGLPCHCAGLISIKGLHDIGIPLHGAYVQNKIRGACFYSPSNLSFTIEGNDYVAYVVNRRALDCFLAEQALKSGSRIILNSRVQSVKRNGGWVLNINGRDNFKAKLLIDAEGALPRVLKATGLKILDKKDFLNGLQIDISGVKIDPERVEVHLGRGVAPGFFAWVIPLNDEEARVGLACKNSNLKNLLFSFIKKRFRYFERMSMHSFYSGFIITCGPIEKTYSDGLIVVGDAAGQVKPISGGGVVFGGICASIAGRVASEAIKRNRLEEKFLKTYENEWKAKFGKEFKIALLARNILNRLSDRDIDKIFSIVIKEKIHNEISAEGDVDFQGTSIWKIMGKGRFLRFLPTLLKATLVFS